MELRPIERFMLSDSWGGDSVQRTTRNLVLDTTTYIWVSFSSDYIWLFRWLMFSRNFPQVHFHSRIHNTLVTFSTQETTRATRQRNTAPLFASPHLVGCCVNLDWIGSNFILKRLNVLGRASKFRISKLRFRGSNIWIVASLSLSPFGEPK